MVAKGIRPDLAKMFHRLSVGLPCGWQRDAFVGQNSVDLLA